MKYWFSYWVYVASISCLSDQHSSKISSASFSVTRTSPWCLSGFDLTL